MLDDAPRASSTDLAHAGDGGSGVGMATAPAAAAVSGTPDAVDSVADALAHADVGGSGLDGEVADSADDDYDTNLIVNYIPNSVTDEQLEQVRPLHPWHASPLGRELTD
jgi:hypothetical protein